MPKSPLHNLFPSLPVPSSFVASGAAGRPSTKGNKSITPPKVSDESPPPSAHQEAAHKKRRKERPIDLDGPGFLRCSEVLSVYPVSRAAWYAGIAEGNYPASVRIGKRAVAWRKEDIRNLIKHPPEF